MQASYGFPPIIGSAPVALILGSLPSRISLRRSEYYANPRNTFWRIMGELFGAGPELGYAERVDKLSATGVAVWDVLASSVRPGSLDADIDARTARPNNFPRFFADHPTVRSVFFNGNKAGELFRAKVPEARLDAFSHLTFETLPSTSPAHAAMTYRDKLARWSAVRSAIYNRQGSAR